MELKLASAAYNEVECTLWCKTGISWMGWSISGASLVAWVWQKRQILCPTPETFIMSLPCFWDSRERSCKVRDMISWILSDLWVS